MATFTVNNVVSELQKQDDSLSKILQLEDFAEEGKLADNLAKHYLSDGDKLKATQLRRFFHAIKNIERGMKGKSGEDETALPKSVRAELLPLLPELAYARGRGLIPDDFYQLLKTCLSSQKLKTVADFKRLVAFLTAIMAYHKFHEGQK